MTGELPESLGIQRVLVIGTGAIGVSHLPTFVTLLRHHYRLDVAVALTSAARDFVSPRALGVLSGRPVIPPIWPEESGPDHVEWADWAEAVIVWPATLDFLSRCAFGISDSLPVSIVVSTKAPVVHAPSLATGAVDGGPFKRAVRLLQQDGHCVVGPVTGHSIANWQVSPGAVAPPGAVLKELATQLSAATPSAPPTAS
ncbi:flavoprotein [Streptomyces sp. G44]|uniref:flavoprotein n=1 Tax=Streptomyces sp. G44 TaxID=2807632 RepID=UPI00195F6C5B|nr:flavoprotein [Streptomyces sp. G44]MBM7167527.1 flavoprotein [Streptomyces sp. G44]